MLIFFKGFTTLAYLPGKGLLSQKLQEFNTVIVLFTCSSAVSARRFGIIWRFGNKTSKHNSSIASWFWTTLYNTNTNTGSEPTPLISHHPRYIKIRTTGSNHNANNSRFAQGSRKPDSVFPTRSFYVQIRVTSQVVHSYLCYAKIVPLNWKLALSTVN